MLSPTTDMSTLHDSVLLFPSHHLASIPLSLLLQPSDRVWFSEPGLRPHQAASLLSLSSPHPYRSALPPTTPSPPAPSSPSPWQPAPWGAAWYPAGHTHRKLPGVFSQRPRSQGGGTRWHSSTSAGTNPAAGSGADTPPSAPPRPAVSGRLVGQGRSQTRAEARKGGRGGRQGGVRSR